MASLPIKTTHWELWIFYKFTDFRATKNVCIVFSVSGSLSSEYASSTLFCPFHTFKSLDRPVVLFLFCPLFPRKLSWNESRNLRALVPSLEGQQPWTHVSKKNLWRQEALNLCGSQKTHRWPVVKTVMYIARYTMKCIGLCKPFRKIISELHF